MIQLHNHDCIIYSYNTKTQQIVIKSDTLHQRLKDGVKIPENRTKDFCDRHVVHLADGQLFHKAFSEFFVKELDQTVFRWTVSSVIAK